MKTLSRGAIGAVLLALAATGAASAQDQIKVGIAAEPYPPFAAPDASGNWSGWEVEIAQALCEAAELSCEITPVAWDGIIPSLTGGNIDAITASMSITAERQQTIDFSDKYYNTPTAVIGPKGEDFEATAEGLSGKIIGVQVSTIHEAYVNKHFGEAAAEVRIYQTQDEANADLTAGRIDAVQADSIALEAFLATEQGAACCEVKGVVPDDVDVLGAGVGVGLRKGDTELKEKFNAAIKTIRENGTYDEISKKYFNFDIYGG